MSEDKLDKILDYLVHMTSRQHHINSLIHGLEERLPDATGELISEFVNDLNIMKDYPENDIRELIKKWEEKL